jgi:LTXXQ motif family protein
MKMKALAAIGTGLTITATIALAQKLPSNNESVPVSFLAAAREASGEFARCTARDAIAAGFLAYAHAGLEVTPDQEPAWTHFTQSFQQALKPIETLCKEVGAKTAPPDTLSGLIERKERSAEVALQVLKSARVAVSDLESSLKPEQKQRLVELVVEFVHLRK